MTECIIQQKYIHVRSRLYMILPVEKTDTFRLCTAFIYCSFVKLEKKEDTERTRLTLKLYNKTVNSKISKRHKI